MANAFTQAINNITYTQNGALTYSTSGDACVDFFSKAGAIRKKNANEIVALFVDAFKQNPEYALRILAYARDIRGGLGEKRVYRLIARTLLDKGANLDVFADMTIEYGSWKDIFEVCTDAEIAHIVKREFARRTSAGEKRPNLMEKYMFSIGGKDNRRAEKLAAALGLSPKAYRKYLAKARKDIDVVETHMCAGDWESINYERVPSKASMNYTHAFGRHDASRYGKYLESVKAGDAKMNASTLYPYEIIRKFYPTYGRIYENIDTEAYELMWKNLKDYTCDGNAIVVTDVSGSMTCDNYMPISVAISLAIYFAERNKGAFHGQMITFSERPTFFNIDDAWSLKDKISRVAKADWEMNTDLNRVFDIILSRCVANNVPAEDMPKTVYCVSDMEFDNCAHLTNYEKIKAQYAAAGYDCPNIVFWKVNDHGSTPVRFNDKGVALVSGCSPSVFELAVSGDLDPVKFMLQAIMKSRYDMAAKLLS